MPKKSGTKSSRRRGRAKSRRTRRAARAAGFRSDFERRIAEQLDVNGVEYEYEPKDKVIEWIPKPRKYLPDFVLANGIIVETKGRFDADDRTRHIRIRELRPELDIRFVFQFDNKLRPSSSTRYSDWCAKHGFKCAFGAIPEEWFDE